MIPVPMLFRLSYPESDPEFLRNPAGEVHP